MSNNQTKEDINNSLSVDIIPFKFTINNTLITEPLKISITVKGNGPPGFSYIKQL